MRKYFALAVLATLLLGSLAMLIGETQDANTLFTFAILLHLLNKKDA